MNFSRSIITFDLYYINKAVIIALANPFPLCLLYRHHHQARVSLARIPLCLLYRYHHQARVSLARITKQETHLHYAKRFSWFPLSRVRGEFACYSAFCQYRSNLFRISLFSSLLQIQMCYIVHLAFLHQSSNFCWPPPDE